jgi:DNA-binding response OmpR family regulator
MTAKNPAQTDGNKSYKKKILLAEDDNSMRRFLEVILQKADYDVISAEDGLLALKAALENEIDAVVADALMPNMTGYDCAGCCVKTPT